MFARYYLGMLHIDTTDHTAHLTCASLGIVFAYLTQPLPERAALLQLTAWWLLLALRVWRMNFPL